MLWERSILSPSENAAESLLDILGAHSVHITVIKHYLLPPTKNFNLKQWCQKLTGRQRNTMRYKNHEKGAADIVIPPSKRDKEEKKLLFLSGAIELRSIINSSVLARCASKRFHPRGPRRRSYSSGQGLVMDRVKVQITDSDLSPRTVKTT